MTRPGKKMDDESGNRTPGLPGRLLLLLVNNTQRRPKEIQAVGTRHNVACS